MHTKSCSKTSGISLAAFLICAYACATGCQSLAGFWVGMQGGELIKAEYELSDGPLLILFDDRAGRIDRPQALRQAHKTTSDMFAEHEVNTRVIPFTEWQRFQQSADKYDRLTIREIGERMGAEQVIYVGVEKFATQSQEGAPIYQGVFEARVKVISTDRTRDVRMWPRDGAGYRVVVSTDPTPMDGDTSEGDVADELGKKMGEKVAKLFYEHREHE
ncbi:MAG: hypothetical protein H6818_01595 [Phycisphaerales bacterium]|nr:hypothetical protein [Phycisphaerales bacterium]MCB9863552.1 hypothetical protein [Phycisphaerales bacterium]